jgi:hypothetical protein
LVDIRAAVSRELIAAQRSGEIRVREQFTRVVSELLLPGSKEFLLISTNWDLVVDDALREFLAMQKGKDVWRVSPISKWVRGDSGSCGPLASSVNRPSSMALRKVFEPQKPRPSSMILSG